jgi:hypothetical protein
MGYLRWLRDKKIGQDLQLRETPVSYDGDESLKEWLESLPL